MVLNALFMGGHRTLSSTGEPCYAGIMLVATSGGPDSQALLHFLAQKAPPHLVACGIDHGLRPEAARELDLAENLAKSLGVPFVRRHVTVPTQGNLLENAREARYAMLHAVAEEYACTRIAVAHTATDQLETMLMHIARGCGLRGASGIPVQRGIIVRPLLRMTRTEILSYLHEHKILFAEDPSNAKRSRGLLRSAVLPALRDLNTQVEIHAADLAHELSETFVCFDALADDLLQASQGPCGALHIDAFYKAPVMRALYNHTLIRWLAHHGVRAGRAHLQQLHAMRAGTVAIEGREFTWDRGMLWPPLPDIAYDIAVPPHAGLLELPHGVTLHHHHGPVDHAAIWQKKSAWAVAFDIDDTQDTFHVRRWREGDRMVGFDGQGMRQVGDLFTDHKIPLPLRRLWPVVICQNKIVWVVGLRRGLGHAITQKTKRMLCLEIPEGNWMQSVVK